MRRIGGLSVFLAASLLLAAGPPPVELEAARLIARLGADSFDEREDATRALEKLGKRARSALRKAADSPDLEVRRRVRALLDKVTPPGTARLVLTGSPHP